MRTFRAVENLVTDTLVETILQIRGGMTEKILLLGSHVCGQVDLGSEVGDDAVTFVSQTAVVNEQ